MGLCMEQCGVMSLWWWLIAHTCAVLFVRICPYVRCRHRVETPQPETRCSTTQLGGGVPVWRGPNTLGVWEVGRPAGVLFACQESKVSLQPCRPAGGGEQGWQV
eukprot:TRINITY_DN880_c0_g2_i1.p2 TRINITY_DN880_c0_g2~~TRINITY_DN880_c0_g2_i1.p2  ORF type:complete len:111 (-),score=3.26 TRINITY_DN880_c0_g2_i1:421-732(-)